jgi:hypothetical protein
LFHQILDRAQTLKICLNLPIYIRKESDASLGCADGGTAGNPILGKRPRLWINSLASNRAIREFWLWEDGRQVSGHAKALAMQAELLVEDEICRNYPVLY